ncbi:glycosyltransferase [Methanospirillum stamsii]|uniref:Glycosyl transferase n=1 Tax=Methanospirillum stamsii TaxID=1277351 RepID=A0A2V2MWK5_9EURY|nr:glycosyltransferase [Methanospirillum stamsii]PWR71769.1 glycosyl transferase [Methanospirillum stamsii]
MKILQVISSFPPAYSYGGAPKVAFDMSKELVKNGHEVTVFTTDAYNSSSRLEITTNPEIMDGINVFRFRNISNTFTRKNFSCAPLMFLSLKKVIQDFDIIHLHEYRSFQALFVHYYAMKYQIPYIIQAHGSVLPIFEKLWMKKIFDLFWGNRILQDASKLIAVSKTEKNQYLKMGIPEDKIVIIPNGINLSEYEKLPEYGKFRKKYKINSDQKIILYLGRIHKSKGIDVLINSYSKLLDQTKYVKLIIVGPDDGYLTSIKELIEKLHIQDNVIITGPLYNEEKIEAFVDADVLVYPGILEIFGLVPFESIMCGTPVIVTDDCGCGELINEVRCGHLVNYGDTQILADTIRFSLNHETDCQNNVEIGKKFISTYLTWKKIGKNVESLYFNTIFNNKAKIQGY